MANVVNDLESPMNARAGGPNPARDHGPATVILAIWAIQFAAFTIDRLIRSPELENAGTLAARLVVSAAGALLSFLVLAILRRSSNRTFLARSVIALLLALVAASVHAVINVVAFRLIVGPATMPLGQELAANLPPLIYFFSWVHLATALVLLSLAYRQEFALRERRLAEVAGQLESLKQVRPDGEDQPHYWVRSGGQRIRINVADIDWIRAEGEYVRLHCGGRSWLERRSMGAMDRLLGPLGFVRVHRSAIVNSARVESLARTESGSVRLKLSTGQDIRVGKAFAGRVRELVGGRSERLRPPATSGRK